MILIPLSKWVLGWVLFLCDCWWAWERAVALAVGIVKACINKRRNKLVFRKASHWLCASLYPVGFRNWLLFMKNGFHTEKRRPKLLAPTFSAVGVVTCAANEPCPLYLQPKGSPALFLDIILNVLWRPGRNCQVCTILVIISAHFLLLSSFRTKI